MSRLNSTACEAGGGSDGIGLSAAPEAPRKKRPVSEQASCQRIKRQQIMLLLRKARGRKRALERSAIPSIGEFLHCAPAAKSEIRISYCAILGSGLPAVSKRY